MALTSIYKQRATALSFQKTALQTPDVIIYI